jgi:hypothetical protein
LTIPETVASVTFHICEIAIPAARGGAMSMFRPYPIPSSIVRADAS